jgi:hypothetical protein
MKYLNIETAVLRSPDYVGAEPTERATWLSLLGYCADQENGGVIKSCRAWADRQWQQTCGVTRQEVNLTSFLYQWCGDDMVVKYYPVTAEVALKAKREGGSKGGRASGRSRREAMLQGMLPGSGEGLLERKGKGKGKGNEKVSEPHTAVKLPSLEEVKAAANMAGVEADIAEKWFHTVEANPLTPDGGWTVVRDGQPSPINMARWQSALVAYAMGFRNRSGFAQNGTATLSSKPPSIWEAKQKKDALQAKLERILANPDSKEFKADSYERVLTPAAKAEVAELRTKIRKLEEVITR